jgi:hypothetical protein
LVDDNDGEFLRPITENSDFCDKEEKILAKNLVFGFLCSTLLAISKTFTVCNSGDTGRV